MPCKKCEKKLKKLATPDVWKKGARNTIGGKHGGIKLGVNKLIEKKRFKFRKLGGKIAACAGKDCKKKVKDNDKYCNLCAYKAGRCKMCGIKILKVKNYKQSNV